nr:sugar transferase [Weissella confusa]
MEEFMMTRTKQKNMNLKDQYEFMAKLQNESPKKSWYISVKRVADFIFALLLFIPALPVVIIFGIAIRLETPGSIFYKQERVGLMGKKIFITKLRSMYADAESKSGAKWADKNDSRITTVGHFIRKTRIDELPQIINVLRGEMSFIGPRPERPNFTEEFSNTVPGFEKRLTITPGLSGLAQIRGGYEATPAEKLKDDLEYINNVSLIQDVRIIIQTIGVVVTGKGAR